MKKYLNTYFQFLTEGGHTFKDVIGIKQIDIPDTLKKIEKDILIPLGLEGFNIDAAVLGSAGKKAKEDDLSGDLDIAISIDKIAANAGISLDEVFNYVNTKCQSLGYRTVSSKGFQLISIAYPIKGNEQLGFCQVDLMLSTSLEWSKFIYHSPDFRKAESKYKGLYRNILLMVAIKLSEKKIVKFAEDGISPEEIEYLAIRFNQGLVKIRKTFKGKNGLVKSASLLKDYNKFITNVPNDIIHKVFGDKYSIKDVETFEKLYDLIFNKDTKVKNIRNEIKEEVKIVIKKYKLPLPSELN